MMTMTTTKTHTKTNTKTKTKTITKTRCSKRHITCYIFEKLGVKGYQMRDFEASSGMIV